MNHERRQPGARVPFEALVEIALLVFVGALDRDLEGFRDDHIFWICGIIVR